MVRMKLKDCMKIETGSRNTEHKSDDGEYPFFVRSQQVERINEYHYDCEAVLTAGDGVGTGKVFHYINGKFDAHQRVYVLSEFQNITGKYFFYYFSKFFYDEVTKYTAKSSVDSVRRDMIAEMEIPVPPIPEQIEIANALSEMDILIDSLEKLIVKKKMIKQGAMQELLTGKKRLDGFNQEWKTVKLGEVADIKDGTHGTFNRIDSGYLLLSAKNVLDNKLVISNSESMISKTDYDFITLNGYPSKGDILLSCVGTIGRCCIYSGYPQAAFQRSVAFVRTKVLNNRFLLYVLQSFTVQKKLQESANASAQGGIYLGALSNIQIITPVDIEEQKAIASILLDMDMDIEKLEEKRNKYHQIKQGMLSELLTGRIRLV